LQNYYIAGILNNSENAIMETKRTDEIDLIEVFYSFANTTKSNFKLLLACCIIGSLLGLAYSLYSKKVYESKMLFTSSLLTEASAIELIENVNSLINEGNHNLAAKEMGISNETLSRLISINIEGKDEAEAPLSPVIKETHWLKLEDQKKVLLNVTAQTSDPTIFVEIQKGIKYFLENNAYVKIRVEQKKELFKQLGSKVEGEIKNLEELKIKVLNGEYFEKTKGDASFDPTIINSKILQLTKDKIDLQHELSLVENIQIIDGFTPYNKPEWPRKPEALLLGAIFGLFIAFLIISFVSISKGLKIREAQKIKT
jgi:uncharacterized protein involved in exopolysaccharide biosynthesis